MKRADPRARREAVEGWLDAADADRKAAEMRIAAGSSLAGVVAFHCQQAVEKLLKGFLTLAGKRGGKTHSLTRLGTAAASFPEITGLVAAAKAWSNWAFEFRYPGDRGGRKPPPDEEELRRALDVIDALAAHLRAANPNPPGS
jgi:HEPN domain-containing protein